VTVLLSLSIMNQQGGLRTLEQICNKTDEILTEAHQLENAPIGEEYKIAQLNRLTGMVEALLWIRYLQELN
jgi:hypothetical protein